MKNVDYLTSPSILGTTRSLMVPTLGCKEGVEFQACHGVLSLCTVVWPCVVMMQRNVFLSGLILRMRCLSDHKVAQHLSEFTVSPLVRNSL
jgi:hypothetical protein